MEGINGAAMPLPPVKYIGSADEVAEEKRQTDGPIPSED
jgi:hypothetical protein